MTLPIATCLAAGARPVSAWPGNAMSADTALALGLVAMAGRGGDRVHP